MNNFPKKTEKLQSEKRIQIIIGTAVLIIALCWGLFHGRHNQGGSKKSNTIKFANYDTDLLLQEQRSYHNDIETKMNINNSNLLNKIESEEKTNRFLSMKLQLLEKQSPKITIIKEKRSNVNEKNDTLNIPSAY
jgi:hypothetical protein